MKFFHKLLVHWLMFILYFELRSLKPLDDVVKVSTDDLGTVRFNHLAIHKYEGTVYIGTVSQLYRLTSDLHLLANTTVAQNTSHKNQNEILIIDYTNAELIACTRAHKYLCVAYDITAHSHSLNPTKKNKELLTGNDADASVVAFMGKTFSGKHNAMFPKMYIGVSYQDNSSKERAITARYLKPDKFLQLNEKDTVNGTLSFDSMLRNDYRVNYIYGFNVGKYNYFLTTQKQSVSAEYPYISKLIRICSHDDKFWQGYVEIPIECKYDNEQPYNLVQMAHIGKPSLQLAQSLNIRPNEYVLFGIFSRGEEMNVSSNKPSNQSAICIYSLETINKKFFKNIQNCYKGHGTRGFGSLLSENRCKEENQFLPSNFCPSSENMPLEGNMPISAYPAITFNSLLTAIASSAIDNQSVVFIGTNAGYLKKVIVNNSSSTCEQASILIDDRSPVNSDLLFSPNGEYLYVMTEHNLRRIDISQISVDNCSGYVDYTTCIHTRSKYCGWCGLTNKCTSKCDCYQRNYALWYSHDFRKYVTIMPNCSIRFQIGFVESLNLTVVGLPLLHDEFYCAFTSGNKTFRTEAINYANKICSYVNCLLPSKNQISPLLKNNKEYFDSTLSLQTNQIKDIGMINITFFDCNTYTTCKTCVRSVFSCQWNSWEKNCQYDWETTSHNSSTNKYGKVCKVTPIITQNTTQRGPTTHFDNIKTNSQQYTARSSTSRSSSSPSTYIPPVSMENSHKKCKSMAHNCSACLSLNKALRCSWCQSTNACEFYDDCTTSEFLDHNDTCINPSPPTITSFWPLKGPLEGGTNVTIEGKNLGCEFEDVRQSIEVAGVVCMTYTCITMRSITCTINSSSSLLDHKGPVKILVNGISTMSKQNFEFVDVKITEISPKGGPTYGDTSLTISGKNLDAGKSVQVFVGNEKCTVFLKNSSAIQCLTASCSTEKQVEVFVEVDSHYNSTSAAFMYFKDLQHDENGFNIEPKGIVSGGIKILLRNLSLPSTQPLTLHVHDGERTYNSLCEIQKNFFATRICLSPPIPHYDTLDTDKPREMNVSFTSNGTSIQPFSNPRNQPYKFWLYPDPIFNYFINSTIEYCEDKFLIIMGCNISKACQKIDIKVSIGNTSCEVKSISSNQVVCLLPKYLSALSKYESEQNYDVLAEHEKIVVSIGKNFKKDVFKQYYNYYKGPNEGINEYIVYGGVSLLIIIFSLFVFYCFISRNSMTNNLKKLKKTRQQITKLELCVASECKEAFAELQMQVPAFRMNVSCTTIPFLNYHAYVMNVLFPNINNHSFILCGKAILIHKEKGLQLFEELIMNKNFLLFFVRTLEKEESFSMNDRVYVAAMMMIILQKNMKYCTDILKTLLAELIQKNMHSRSHPKLLLRRTESVVEKMLSTWFSFLLFRFLKESAGKPLFNLFIAIKEQVNRGPCDAVTSQALYCLSENKILRKKIKYCTLTIYVNVSEQTAKIIGLESAIEEIPVQALDCDTISQFKEKSLDAINLAMNSSTYVDASELAFEWFHDTSNEMILSDIDSNSIIEGEWRRINTLKHYGVQNGSILNLISNKELNYHSSINVPVMNCVEVQNNVKYRLSFPFFKTQRMRSIESLTTLIQRNDPHYKEWHLIKPYSDEDEDDGEELNKHYQMIPEIYLTRLLTTKSSLQGFVDNLFSAIFKAENHNGCFPAAIKYLFDFLDDQAYLNGITDPEVVHVWKNNCLPLRFWVNLIKNPNFLFNIHKSNIVDSCLSVIAQVFMDSCSTFEHRLDKDSTTTKLLYAKEIPIYNNLVKKYYSDIKSMPKISSQDMEAMFAEESKNTIDFDTNTSVHELFKYAVKYKDKLVDALKGDEFSKNDLLVLKLELVIDCMSNILNL